MEDKQGLKSRMKFTAVSAKEVEPLVPMGSQHLTVCLGERGPRQHGDGVKYARQL